ncbi:IclR family transcriptional regulator [Streptomyces sp. NPDC048106]|uniref:IclR family transcriptional regulator n=1 Tax=Streptomyces sp. NPDC048106 TaxID=3155750 RepID=UPI0034548775
MIAEQREAAARGAKDADSGESEARRSVLGRAFELLDCFDGLEPDQSIASLCRQTGLPPATVHRLLASLVEWGAVERSSRGHYRLGMRLWRLGWGVPEARVVRDVARPFMVDLYAMTREIVVLGSREGDSLLLVDQIAGQSAEVAWRSARRVPLGALAPGLVYLAQLPLDDLRRKLADSVLGLPAELADNEYRLLQTLAEIRATGVAVSRGRSRGWISAPVLDADGSVRSTLSMVVPEQRLNVTGHGRLVGQAARAVSRSLAARRALDQP